MAFLLLSNGMLLFPNIITFSLKKKERDRERMSMIINYFLNITRNKRFLILRFVEWLWQMKNSDGHVPALNVALAVIHRNTLHCSTMSSFPASQSQTFKPALCPSWFTMFPWWQNCWKYFCDLLKAVSSSPRAACTLVLITLANSVFLCSCGRGTIAFVFCLLVY